MQMRLLEGLFGREWFSSPHPHPAYHRWMLCNELLRKNELIDRRDTDQLFRLLELVLDNCSLVQVTEGQLGRFILGDLANYGDVRMQNRIRSVIHDARQFKDLLFELNYAAWHLSRGNQVRAFEAEGYPDFEIIVPSAKIRLATDCKRVQLGTSENRFSKLVNKSNKQIKKLAPCPGLLVVDVTDRISPCDKISPLNKLEAPDPADVDRVAVLLKNAMHTYNRAVTAALITWRTMIITPMTDGSGGTACFFLQKSRVIRHSDPFLKLPDDDFLSN